MNKWMLLLAGLVLSLGAYACSSAELSTETSAGLVQPVISPTSTTKTIRPTPTIAGRLTETQTPTHSPTKSAQPTASLTSTPATSQACQDSSGRIEAHQIESDLLDEPLEYQIYLPPCYNKNLDRHYPVVYLFHGQTYTNQHWIDLGATRIADRLIFSEEIAPFIMVFPFDRDHYIPPTDNLFGDAVLVDLIPAVDKIFRTIPTRTYRAIGGISRGGNWAAHLGLQNPDLFDAVGLHSTPIFSTDTNREIKEWLEAIPIKISPRLFLDIGQNDRWLRYTLIFEELLDEANFPHEWHLYPGYHEDAYWETHMEQYIRWYTREWPVDVGSF